MSVPQPSSHVGQRHRQDRPKALTSDDLNAGTLALGHALEVPEDKRADLQRSYYGSIKHGQAAGTMPAGTAALPDIPVGRATYTFTKGDAGVLHVYTAEVTEDGKIMNEKIGYMADKETIVPTTLGPNVTEQFEEFARKDIKNARARNLGQNAQVSRDISRANDYHGKTLLDKASERDYMDLMKQSRMPKDPGMKLGGLY